MSMRRVAKDPKTGKLREPLKPFERVRKFGKDYVEVEVDMEALTKAVEQMMQREGTVNE